MARVIMWIFFSSSALPMASASGKRSISTFSLRTFSSPLYEGFLVKTIRVTRPSSVCGFMVYGPEPSTWKPVRASFAGYFALGTMPAAGVASLYGKVASGVFRWKTTWLSPLVSIMSMLARSPTGPLSELMSMTRWMEYFTSSAVTGVPSANFKPGRRVQR